MNWLAHLLLSEPTPEFRLGNLLPDFIPPTAIAALPEEFRRGAACHRRIDAFTDAHPVVRRSRARIAATHRRYSGILVDIFYDHVLAREWTEYAAQPFEDFLAEFRAAAVRHGPTLPDEMQRPLARMREDDWLGGYRELAGIERALARLSCRLRRPVELAAATADLAAHYDGFSADLAEFFPELCAHVRAEFPAVPAC